MFNQKKQEAAMNLPVGSHVDRLAEMIGLMKHESDSLQKDLQILRGSITQLSYINKEADQ
jgi:endonuclease III